MKNRLLLHFDTWFEREESILFVSPIYKLCDRSAVGHYGIHDANGGSLTHVCKSVGLPNYIPGYKPSV